MEVLSVLLIAVFVVIFLKLFSILLHTGVFLLTLPIKILSVLLSLFVVLIVLVPVGIVGALAGLLAVPLIVVVLLLPFFLILYGIYLLINRS